MKEYRNINDIFLAIYPTYLKELKSYGKRLPPHVENPPKRGNGLIDPYELKKSIFEEYTYNYEREHGLLDSPEMILKRLRNLNDYFTYLDKLRNQTEKENNVNLLLNHNKNQETFQDFVDCDDLLNASQNQYTILNAIKIIQRTIKLMMYNLKNNSDREALIYDWLHEDLNIYSILYFFYNKKQANIAFDEIIKKYFS